MRLGATFVGALLLLLAGGAVLGVLGWQGFVHEGKQRQQERVEALRTSLETAARNLKAWARDFQGTPHTAWLIVNRYEDATRGLAESTALILEEADYVAFTEQQPERAEVMLRSAIEHIASADLDEAAHAQQIALIHLRRCRILTMLGQGDACAQAAADGLALPIGHTLLDPKSTLLRHGLLYFQARSLDSEGSESARSKLLSLLDHGQLIHTGTSLPPERLLELLPHPRGDHQPNLDHAVSNAQRGSWLASTMKNGDVSIVPIAKDHLMARRTADSIELLHISDVLHQGAGLNGASVRKRMDAPRPDLPIVAALLPAELGDFELVAPAPDVVASRTAKTSLLLGLGIFALGVLIAAWGVWKARRAQRLQADFVASVSHEMKTPIASVRAMAEFMEDEEDASPRMRTYAKHIVKEMTRLGASVRDVLDAARVERAGHYVIQPSPNRPSRVLQDVVEQMRPVVAEHSLTLNEAIEPDSRDMPIDADALAAAIRNLIDNACKFGTHGGAIDVSGIAVEQAYRISVADRGVGLRGESGRRLFKRFVRGSSADESAVPGVGLGLYFVREIAIAHGGTVHAEDRDGGGARFTIELPYEAKDRSP